MAKISIKAVELPEITPYSKKGQIVQLVGNDTYIYGTVYQQTKPTDKIYTVTIGIQLNDNTGVPYAAMLHGHKGGKAITAKGLKSINLSKLTFITSSGKSIKVSNSGKLV